MNDKFGITALLTHWQGDGWADGTKGQGQNYFVSMGYKASKKHNLNFLITGAPQWHDQNFTKKISAFEDADGNINAKFNNNWGLLNGEYLSSRRNYYHKPVANLNWSWNMSEKSSLSTVVYASWGRGGGTGGYGNGTNYIPNGTAENGTINWDAVVDYNSTVAGGIGNAKTYTGSAIRASANNHAWYGVVSTYETQLSEKLNFSIGADLRTYKGTHFRELVNLLGLTAFDETDISVRADANNPRIISATFKADPWSALFNTASVDDRIAYDYDERISYGGLFGQLEYLSGPLSGYLQASASIQSHIRWDRYGYSVAEEESAKITNPGFNVKGGANYNLNESNGIFINAGYYSRQPYHDNLYLNYGNTVNEVAENENVIGLEAGYKLRSDKFDLNFNLYRTAWTNRVETRSIFEGDVITLEDGTEYTFLADGFSNQSNINQLHMGAELDARFRATKGLVIKGFASLGNWQFQGNATQDIYDSERKLLKSVDALFLDGAKVGGSAQTTMGLGLDYRITKDFQIDADFNYYDNLYAEVGPQDGVFSSPDNKGVISLPSFSLLDAGASYKFNFGDNILKVRVNVYNLLDAEYISYATSNVQPSTTESENYNGVNKSNYVQFGKGRTFNVSLRFQF